jgi:hypothetical protein
MKIIEKALGFLDMKKRVQKKKISKLQGIIEQLEAAKEKAKRAYKAEKDDARRKEKLKEFRALCKLLKKSRKRLRKLGE